MTSMSFSGVGLDRSRADDPRPVPDEAGRDPAVRQIERAHGRQTASMAASARIRSTRFFHRGRPSMTQSAEPSLVGHVHIVDPADVIKPKPSAGLPSRFCASACTEDTPRVIGSLYDRRSIRPPRTSEPKPVPAVAFTDRHDIRMINSLRCSPEHSRSGWRSTKRASVNCLS